MNNRKILLKSRPNGMPVDENFELVSEPVGTPVEGEVLCRTVYMSLDPYMRGRMSAAKSYAKPVEIGDVMEGGTVSRVIESNYDGLEPGDIVLGHDGWQEYGIAKGKHVRKLDPELAPVSTALGVLGMPGMTAYTGLHEIGQPQAGETLVVSAASGAVGGVVGQIAKIKGCRVIGIAGTEEKCRYVESELGFDRCINHRSDNLGEQLDEVCPDGIDVYWENVGGKVLEAVIPRLNFQSRVPVCGIIANYNDTALPEGPNYLPRLMRVILTQRVLIRGFIVTDFAHLRPRFEKDMSHWIKNREVRYREDIVEGLENAVSAFQGLLQGRNFGKLLVQLSEIE